MVNNEIITSDNIFSSFPQYDLKRTGNYIKNNQQSTDSTDKIELNTKKTSSRKKILFGSTIASSIVTAGVLAMVLVKGFHGGAYSRLSKITEKLTKEITETNLESTKDLANKTVYYAKKATNKTADTMKAASNFTAIKDWVSDKIFRTNKATTKFADGSKKEFKKIVGTTLGKKYDKVEIKVNDLTSLLKQYNIKNLSNLSETQKHQAVTIKGTTKTLAEWTEILSSQTNRLESAYSDGFSYGARKIRDQKRNGLLSGISDKIEERFFKNKGFLKLKNYKTYVTADVSSAAQKELKSDIMKNKKEITNNIPFIHDGAKNSLNKISDIISPEDKNSREVVKLLKQKLEEFKLCSGADEAQSRKKITEEISSIIDKTVDSVKNSHDYSAVDQKTLIGQLEKIKSSMLASNSNSKGALEEIMTILKGLNSQGIETSGKKIISDSEFKEFSKLSKKISKGLNKAADLEAGEYFLKQAELEVGSAPTDILSLVFPIGAGAFAIAKGDNKDEKVSAVLTTCIPLVGTFATFIYGTAKMFTGPKNMLVSMISGVTLSALGNYCDKLYKKYKASGSVTEVAKEEYNKFWTGLTPEYVKSKEENIK